MRGFGGTDGRDKGAEETACGEAYQETCEERIGAPSIIREKGINSCQCVGEEGADLPRRSKKKAERERMTNVGHIHALYIQE